MKILSKSYVDYYDGTLHSLFHDSELLWVRNARTTRHKDLLPWNYYGNRFGWDTGVCCQAWPFGDPVYTSISPRMPTGKVSRQERKKLWRARNYILYSLKFVGFCGEVYPVFIQSERHPSKKNGGAEFKWTHEYRYESIDIDTFQIKLLFASYKRGMPQPFKDRWMQMMIEQKSPTFIADPKTFTIDWNPCLLDLDFQKIVDAPQASQDIFKFFANISHPGNPIPEQSNNNKITSNGFDLKTSFRKPPSPKHRKH